jgi:hypothetical protein
MLVCSVLVVVAAVVVATTLAGSGGGGGAVVLTNGSRPGHAYVGGNAFHPGEVADFPVTVENTGSAPVTLLSARLIPVPGFRMPRLIHLGVLAEHEELLTSAQGWPIRETDHPPGGWAIRPFHGYVVLPWSVRKRRHLGAIQDMIEYGVVGSGVNVNYAAAGLRVTYRVGGSIHTQNLYDGGVDCVLAASTFGYKHARFEAQTRKYCDGSYERVSNAVFKLAAGG